jgi:hypothetical protein
MQCENSRILRHCNPPWAQVGQGGSLRHVFIVILTRPASVSSRTAGAEATWASQRSLHNAPIFRLLLKVAVNGTHQCDFLNFCGGFGSQLCQFVLQGPVAACNTGSQMALPRAVGRSMQSQRMTPPKDTGRSSQNATTSSRHVGRSSQAYFLLRNSAMDDSIGGS